MGRSGRFWRCGSTAGGGRGARQRVLHGDCEHVWIRRCRAPGMGSGTPPTGRGSARWSRPWVDGGIRARGEVPRRTRRGSREVEFSVIARGRRMVGAEIQAPHWEAVWVISRICVAQGVAAAGFYQATPCSAEARCGPVGLNLGRRAQPRRRRAQPRWIRRLGSTSPGSTSVDPPGSTSVDQTGAISVASRATRRNLEPRPA